MGDAHAKHPRKNPAPERTGEAAGGVTMQVFQVKDEKTPRTSLTVSGAYLTEKKLVAVDT